LLSVAGCCGSAGMEWFSGMKQHPWISFYPRPPSVKPNFGSTGSRRKIDKLQTLGVIFLIRQCSCPKISSKVIHFYNWWPIRSKSIQKLR
jgi:hypothetical protein